jgi:hypothetical protein
MTLEAHVGRSFQLALDQRLPGVRRVTTGAGNVLPCFEGIGFAFDGVVIAKTVARHDMFARSLSFVTDGAEVVNGLEKRKGNSGDMGAVTGNAFHPVFIHAGQDSPLFFCLIDRGQSCFSRCVDHTGRMTISSTLLGRCACLMVKGAVEFSRNCAAVTLRSGDIIEGDALADRAVMTGKTVERACAGPLARIRGCRCFPGIEIIPGHPVLGLLLGGPKRSGHGLGSAERDMAEYADLASLLFCRVLYAG